MRGLLAGTALLALGGVTRAADVSPIQAPPGALSCSGCHAARGGETGLLPRLAGRPADETAAAVAAFRSGERPGTLMNRIAKGFSDEEIRAIAIWLEAQK